MANRFTVRDTDNIQELNQQELLLKIMRETFPNDLFYQQGVLSPAELTKPLYDSNATDITNTRTSRNAYNVINVTSGSRQLTEYTINKLIPTVDETILDDLLDDEWEYFVSPTELREPVQGGLFLIPKEIQLNPIDFHDAYIQRGPEMLSTLALNNDINELLSNIFCVYYIDNDIAYPIPNYKTLEVMLVERGLTYSAIREANYEQLRKFDMIFDGKFEGDPTPIGASNPIEEFNFRKLADRTIDWNLKVRFDSGYRPSLPFHRDPGDYLKPIGYSGIGTTDKYILEDPNDRYFDLVFQGQTYKEKLREKYEGKMVIDKWPVPYSDSAVVQSPSIRTDDLVLGVRLMINGYWKGIAIAAEGGSRVFEAYAQINNYSLKDFQPGLGRYGERGYINLLINQGGLTVLHVQEDERPSVVWDDFAHIAEVDRLDPLEYFDYIDNFSNNGQPFDIEYLNPYEPKGSILYYKQIQLDKLQQQAAQQAAFDNIKEQILEYWPKLATRTEELNSRLTGAMQGTYDDYFRRRFGNNCPSYNIITSSDTWKYVKKKKKELKTKDEHINLLALYENNNRMSGNISYSDEQKLVSDYKWGYLPDDNLVKSWGKNGGTIPYTSYSYNNDIRTEMTLIGNAKEYDLPREGGRKRRKSLMRDETYSKAMIYTELNKRVSDAKIKSRINEADILIKELRESISEATELLLSIDNRLFVATTVTELQDIYNSIMELYTFTTSISNQELQYCIDTQYEIDRIFKIHLNDLFNSIELLRKQINDDVGNATGKKGRFGIQWPESAKSIINAYLPGKSFDNYLPTEEE